jgi:hypothetical protein
LNAQMLDALCAVIRETGASDSAAAARVGVHPSTVSRWKRDCPDFAIVLRAARGEFREAQLAIIHAEETAGRATSWRAAAWVLERIFPEDYAPRARERARFQEMYEAACAREVEGWEGAGEGETMRQSDNETIRGEACDLGGALQNVQNAVARPVRPAGEVSGLPVRALQNVQNGAVGGDRTPKGNGAARDGSIHVGDHVSHRGGALQNVQNSALKMGGGAARAGSIHVEDHVSHVGGALQNVQNSAPRMGNGAAHGASIHMEDRASQVIGPGASMVEWGREED